MGYGVVAHAMTEANLGNDPLKKIARMRVPTNWSYLGSMTFFGEDLRIDGNGESSVAIVDGRGMGTLVVAGIVHLDGGAHGVVTLAMDGHTVHIPAFIHETGSSTSRAEGSRTTFGLSVQEIDASTSDARAYFARETILGMRLDPHDTTTLYTKLETRLFGRRTMVASCATNATSKETDAVQVVYEGVSLPGDERDALFDVLRFLTAVRGGSFLHETFDRDGAPLGFRFHGHGTCLRDGRGPVALHPVWRGSETERVAREFPSLVEAMRQLRARSRLAVAATIHHYNDGSVQSYPTSKLRDMSVALEALGVVLLGRQAARTSIISDFDERIVPVREAFDAAFGDLALDDGRRETYDWVNRKFENLNIAGPREELFAALDALDIGLSPTERSWIRKMRNGILHSGHHGDESIVEDLRVNAEAAEMFANVYARAMLRMLGFTGRYRDAVSGESLPLDAAPEYPLLR